MKIYKDYNREPYSFLVHDATLSSYNSFDLGGTYYKNEY